MRIVLHHRSAAWLGLTAAALLLTVPGCLVRKETRVHPAQLPPPAREATLAELLAKTNTESEAIHTLTATVDLEPTAGSVYSGIIKEYHDVKGFILAERPSLIHILGQAPVVRTTIFDMVSNGQEFRLFIPPKQKFIVGRTSVQHPAKNALENLRPQHILQALFVSPIDSSREKCFIEQAEDNQRRYYVVTVTDFQAGGELALLRKVWFDRADLQVARVQFYGREGAYTEDVHYAEYKDFQGIQYPTRIDVTRPAEDYRLTLTIEKATFNQPIPAQKFELKKPEGVQLVDLDAPRSEENPRGQ